jgi:hypothetical protein
MPVAIAARQQAGKRFFVEKKNPETFATWPLRAAELPK